MAAPGPWVVYNDLKLNMAKGLVALHSDALKVALFTAASIAISPTVSPATYTAFAADAHEVASGTGYPTGGVACGAQTLSGGGALGTIGLSIPNLSFPAASGIGYTARVAVLYDSTSAAKNAIAYCILDSTPADVVVTTPQVLTIQIGNVFNETGN